jgi:hypothetical protein
MLWGSIGALKSRRRRRLKHLQGGPIWGILPETHSKLLLAPILVPVLAPVLTPFLAPSLADADADVDALAEDNNAGCYRRIRVALGEMEKPTHKHAKTSARRAGAYNPQFAAIS